MHPPRLRAVPATHVVSQHQSAGLDHKLVGLFVSDHSGCETGRSAGLPAGVHRPGAELLYMPAAQVQTSGPPKPLNADRKHLVLEYVL